MLKIIDFGTAKDLIQTDLNGPEFVGTPDYMSPTTVKGKNTTPAESAAADLWALGIIIYQLLFGHPAFQAPSPYLTFLRIQRCNLKIPSFAPEPVKDILHTLLMKDNTLRMKNAIGPLPASDNDDANLKYSGLRSHPFFHSDLHFEKPMHHDTFAAVERVPSLLELCIRAVGRACEPVTEQIALHGSQADIPDEANFAWIKRFNLMRLREPIRKHIAYYLSRRQRLHPPSTLRLFHPTAVDTRLLGRIDKGIREVIGFSRDMHIGNSITGKSDKKKIGYQPLDDEYAFNFIHLSDPSLEFKDDAIINHETLKLSISAINKLRPRFVLMGGSFTARSLGHTHYDQEVASFRKLSAKVSETIPVLLIPGVNDVCEELSNQDRVITPRSLDNYRKLFGADYFGMWYGMVRVLVINTALLIDTEVSCTPVTPLKRSIIPSHSIVARSI